jgi:hypothetical protein
LSDLVTWSKTSMPTVQREVNRAEQAGLVTSAKVGPTRLVHANTAHPLYGAVRQILLATYGPPAVVAQEFQKIAKVDAVVLFGSWAARYLGHPGPAPNDVDVMVIGNANRDVVHDAAARAERRIGLPVQATIRTPTQWTSGRESFIKEVRSRPLVLVLVADEDSALAAGLRELDGLQGASRRIQAGRGTGATL